MNSPRGCSRCPGTRWPTTQRCRTSVATSAATEPIPVVEARGVTLQYKTSRHLVTATYRVDFAVLASDRFVLLGPSGCGKSTLLKAVGGYLKPVQGEILAKGHVVTHPPP